MRILHAPSNIANQAWGAVQGLRSLGHQAEVWHYLPNAFSFPADRLIDVEDRAAGTVAAFVDAIQQDFDVFHFHYARSLLRARQGLPLLWDVPVLKALGKRVLFTFHGSDVRLRSAHLEEDPWSYFRYSDIPCDEESIRMRLAVARTYADGLIVAGAPLLMFVPEAAYVPKIVEVDVPRAVREVRARPLVVHAPSRRGTKGTDFVLRAVEALRSDRRVDFDFEIVEGVSHGELMTLLARADVLVDNLLIGDCEVTALEAMARGAVVVTRMRDDVRRAHPENPAVHADPDTVVHVLRELVRDSGRRRELSDRGPEYVRASHAPDVVARRLQRLYERPPRRISVGHPDWAAGGIEQKREMYEQRILSLSAELAAARATAPVDAGSPTAASSARRPGDRARGGGWARGFARALNRRRASGRP